MVKDVSLVSLEKFYTQSIIVTRGGEGSYVCKYYGP